MEIHDPIKVTVNAEEGAYRSVGNHPKKYPLEKGKDYADQVKKFSDCVHSITETRLIKPLFKMGQGGKIVFLYLLSYLEDRNKSAAEIGRYLFETCGWRQAANFGLGPEEDYRLALQFVCNFLAECLLESRKLVDSSLECIRHTFPRPPELDIGEVLLFEDPFAFDGQGSRVYFDRGRLDALIRKGNVLYLVDWKIISRVYGQFAFEKIFIYSWALENLEGILAIPLLVALNEPCACIKFPFDREMHKREIIARFDYSKEENELLGLDK